MVIRLQKFQNLSLILVEFNIFLSMLSIVKQGIEIEIFFYMFAVLSVLVSLIGDIYYSFGYLIDVINDYTFFYKEQTFGSQPRRFLTFCKIQP